MAESPRRRVRNVDTGLPSPMPDGWKASATHVEWMPDSATKVCLLCAKKFSWMRHRHHCRACGKIFCADCSPHRMKVEGVGMARVCRTCFISHHDASRSQVDTRQHIGSGDGHDDSGASHVGPPRRTVLSEPLHARPQRSATHSSGMRVRNEQRRRSSSSGMFERGYICDDALLPTTRVTRRILPAVQWLTLNFDAAWRWESCFLPGCVAVAWATMWLYPSVAASVACLLAVVVVLHERAVMMLRPFVGLPMSGFRKYGRTTLRVCDDDLRGEALTEHIVASCEDPSERPRLRTLYAVATVIADWLDRCVWGRAAGTLCGAGRSQT